MNYPILHVVSHNPPASQVRKSNLSNVFYSHANSADMWLHQRGAFKSRLSKVILFKHHRGGTTGCFEDKNKYSSKNIKEWATSISWLIDPH